MSLVGIDIESLDDIETLHNSHSIELFQISAKNIDSDDVKPITGISLAVHYSYSINIGRAWKPNDWWIQRLIHEIKTAHAIGAWCIVIHIGKSLTASVPMAINNMYSSLMYAHSQTLEQADLKILLETPAGQGSEVLTRIEDFARFMKKFYTDKSASSRFGVCIDTCHVYAAGHDISKRSGIEHLFKTIDDVIGIDKIKLVHLNNSIGELGSRKDRHAALESEAGTIPFDSMQMIVQFINRLEIPMVLETPLGKNYVLIIKDQKLALEMIR